MGWLYALHARSSIARGRALQAPCMINGIREAGHLVGLPPTRTAPDQGRGADDLPENVKQGIADTVPRGFDPAELNRSFAGVTHARLVEAHKIDAHQATLRMPSASTRNSSAPTSS